MVDKRVILPESKDELIEKWLPVIEGTGKWEKVVDGMPKVDAKGYSLLATQLEVLEQTELSEATQTGAITNYTPVLIPMVRRVMPALIGTEIFGTQPLNGPSGLIFALKSLYQSDGNSEVNANYEILLLDTEVAVFEDLDQVISGDVAGDGKVVHGEGKMVLVKLTSASTTFAGDADVDDVVIGSYATSVAGVDRVFTDAEALSSIVFQNFSGTMSTAVGENLGLLTKELGFEITSSSVEAKTRKLKTRWTIELEDDLRAVHGLNAEQLLSGFCGDEIVKEMNREFIDKVKVHAGTTSSNGLATATWTFPSDQTTLKGRYENEAYQSLANFISRQRRKLALSNLRGQATWMIISLGVLTALEATGKLKSGATSPLGNAFVGTYEGMKVYVDMFPTIGEDSDFIYLGYKGDEIDAGVYYCPYIPLKVNKGYGEEDNIPRLFFSTRYGLCDNPFGAANYFQKIIVANLP